MIISMNTRLQNKNNKTGYEFWASVFWDTQYKVCFVELTYRLLIGQELLQLEILNGLNDKTFRTAVGNEYLVFVFGSKSISLLIFERTVFEKTKHIGGPHFFKERGGWLTPCLTLGSNSKRI